MYDRRLDVAVIRKLVQVGDRGLTFKNSTLSAMDSQSSTSTTTATPPELKLSIRTPAAVSALALGKGNYLAVGAGEV